MKILKFNRQGEAFVEVELAGDLHRTFVLAKQLSGVKTTSCPCNQNQLLPDETEEGP